MGRTVAPMIMPSHGHEYAAVQAGESTAFAGDDSFDDYAEDEPIFVPDAPRRTGRKVVAMLGVCVLAGASGGGG
jgi:hypothetical protein